MTGADMHGMAWILKIGKTTIIRQNITTLIHDLNNYYCLHYTEI